MVRVYARVTLYVYLLLVTMLKSRNKAIARAKVFESLRNHTKLKLMKKNTKNVQMSVPDKSGICTTCFYKFHDRSSKTGFYCIKLHKEVLLNGNC